MSTTSAAIGVCFSGMFVADSRGRMRFVELECTIPWGHDDSHEEAKQ